MKKILILVEGQTEEQFVKWVLSPHFENISLFFVPIIIKTKRVINGPDHKGGLSSYDQVVRDLRPILGDSSASGITTMFDYYSLPDDFPGYSTLPSTNCYKIVDHLENSFSSDIGDSRFIPYLQLHEFETLLFSDPQLIANTIGVNDHIKDQLLRIKNSFVNPELINNNPATCPHRRIESHIPEYDKPLYGAMVAVEIGLKLILKECNHFKQWIDKLEALA